MKKRRRRRRRRKKKKKKKKKKRRKRKKRRRRSKQALPVLRANSIFDWSTSRHSRLRQGSKIDYSSITLRLVSSSIPPLSLHRLVASSFSSSSPCTPLSPPILPSSSPHRSPGPSNWASLSLSLSLFLSIRNPFSLVSVAPLGAYRGPISGPLGFTWRALMTSWNERVPPPSNKRLFHVPMLIPRESSPFAPFFLSFFSSLGLVLLCPVHD